MNKIKVMVCIQSLNDGGAQKIALNNLEAFANDKDLQFELFVCNHTLNSSYEKYANERKLKVHYLMGKKWCYLLAILAKLHIKINTDKYQKKLWEKAIKKYAPDIIHIHLAVLFDVILEPIEKTSVPLKFVTLHSSPYRQSDDILKKIRKAFIEDDFTALCLTYEQIEQAKENYKIKNYELLRNGTNFQKLKDKQVTKDEARKVLNLPKEAFVISTVGRLEVVKNYSFLIDVFYALQKKSTNAVLVFAGEGSLRGELEKKSSDYGISEKVKFLGNVTNVAPVYCASDVFTLTSVSEASSLVLLELQQFNGRAVVSAGVPSESIVTNRVKKMEAEATINMWVDALLDENYVGKPVCDKQEYDYDYANNRLKQIYLKYWTENNAK